MIKDIFIGVDGGGTKTKMRIEDAEGHLLGEGRGGPAQIRVSAEQAWKSITDTFFQILKELSIDPHDKNYRFHAGLALAGTEIQVAYNAFINHPNPFNTVCLKSDAYAACLGAHNGADGSIIIIGTGTKGLQIEGTHVTEVGGWGFPQSDEGSGAWLGLQAIRFTLQHLDGRLPSSPLFDSVLEKFNGKRADLLDWTLGATSSRYGTIAPIVIHHMELKEPVSLRIMKEAALNIDAIGTALNEQALDQTKLLPCCLFGGIAPYMKPFLSTPLQNQIIDRMFGASKGAILMLQNEMKQKRERS